MGKQTQTGATMVEYVIILLLFGVVVGLVATSLQPGGSAIYSRSTEKLQRSKPEPLYVAPATQ